MPKIPFIGRPYIIQSLLIDANIYVDLDIETKELTLYSRPGLSKWLDTGFQAEVRNMFATANYLYVVVGSNLLKIDVSGTIQNLGQLNTSSGYVWMEKNSHQGMIVDGQNGYLVDVGVTNLSGSWTAYGTSSTIYQSNIGSVPPTFVYDQDSQTVLLNQTQSLTQLAAGQYFYDGSLLYVWTSTGQAPNNVLINQYSADSLTQITDPGFLGAGSLSMMDLYFIVHSGMQFQPSNPNNGTIWDAGNFGTKEGYPDAIVTTFSDHRELWLFGETTTEVWFDAGGFPFPFSQVPGGFSETGCGAAASPAKVDESIFWLTNKGQVARAVQYSPQVVSTRRMEWNIAQYTRTDDARGWKCFHEGRQQYHLSFPSAGVTWVYEPQTDKWHRRTSRGTTGNWRANCCVEFDGKWLVGDYENGLIYEIDSTVFQDNGQEIERIWTFPSIEDKGKRIPHDRLDVIIQGGIADEQNTATQMALSWSNDGEKTFGNEVWRSPGKIGEYKNRIRYSQLGITRQRSYRIRQTDNSRTVIRDVVLNEDL